MNPSGSFLSLLLQGGLLSILILIVLLGMSILSWAVIVRKWRLLAQTMKLANQYLGSVDFKSGLVDIVHRSEIYANTFTAVLFQSAYEEFTDLGNSEIQMPHVEFKKESLARIERNIENAIAFQTGLFEKDLSILATISASAPFIGLFGTVTGIIDAFYSIGYQGAASIAVVAPGISAALVATAFGLFAAIPALIGYNLFRNRVRMISNEMRRFSLDLMNLFAIEISKSSGDKSSLLMNRTSEKNN